MKIIKKMNKSFFSIIFFWGFIVLIQILLGESSIHEYKVFEYLYGFIKD